VELRVAEQPVVAMSFGNAKGARGLHHSVKLNGQPKGRNPRDDKTVFDSPANA
jgi:hypothetical protein